MPGQGTKIPHATKCGPKIKTHKKIENLNKNKTTLLKNQRHMNHQGKILMLKKIKERKLKAEFRNSHLPKAETQHSKVQQITWGLHTKGASFVARLVKNPPAMWETWV